MDESRTINSYYGMICRKCKKLKDREHETGFGTWPCECSKLHVGRNPDSDACRWFDAITRGD